MGTGRQGHQLLVASLTAIGLVVLPASAGAATITVNETADVVADDEKCSLREAISASNANAAQGPGGVVDCVAGDSAGADLIQVPAGDFNLGGGAGEDANASGDLDIVPGAAGAGVRIVGGGRGETVIDANGVDRVLDSFALGGVKAGPLTIEHLTITGGDVTGTTGGAHEAINGGAGLRATFADVLLRDLDITGNTTEGNSRASGGGVHFYFSTGSTLTIEDSSITENHADEDGGGVASVGGSTVISNSSIDDNTTGTDEPSGYGYGGGVSTQSGALTLNEGTSVSRNSGAGEGGGVYFVNGDSSSSPLFLADHLTVALNEASGAAEGRGGGIYIASGNAPFAIRDSHVVGNTLSGTYPHGGGIRVSRSASNSLITGTSINGNEVTVVPDGTTTTGNGVIGGGGLDIWNGTATARDSTFFGNTVKGGDVNDVIYGGGVLLNGGGPINPSRGTLFVERTAILLNFLQGVADRRGGGIGSNATGRFTLTNTTLSGNSAGSGGAIAYNGTNVAFAINYTTISDNNANSAPAIRADAANGLERVVATIFDQGAAGCTGMPSVSGSNLDAGASCAGPGDMRNAQIALAPLAPNGGPTLTHQLLGPAGVDAVADDDCRDANGQTVDRDQRLAPRPFQNCDVGAVEQTLCGGQPAYVGSTGDDTIDATVTGPVDGIDGNDTITGGSGADRICGGEGTDSLDAGGSDDRLDGGPGNDTIQGGAGTDEVSYAWSFGAITADLAADTATQEFGDPDTIPGIESIVGGFRSDNLRGDAGVNRIDGGPDGDSILGGAGADQLLGSAGADQIDSLDGAADAVDCGADIDTFKDDNSLDSIIACESDLTPLEPIIVPKPMAPQPEPTVPKCRKGFKAKKVKGKLKCVRKGKKPKK